MPTRLFLLLALLFIAGCASAPPPGKEAPAASPRGDYLRLSDPTQVTDLVVFALGLVDTGYRFGGKNPEAGLDCSGMVSYVVEQVAGLRLPHNAQQIASLTRPIDRLQLRPGDLVFFNTLRKPYSHMGLYIGEGRFVHAPASKGRVRIDRLDSTYFAERFDGARSLAN